jgi:ABC-2 type transport system ATP-binding protein
VTAVIQVSDLQKGYGSVRAVDGVSFSIEPGEFFGILGPNGAGKTTTLETIESLREPDRGQTLLFGIHRGHVTLGCCAGLESSSRRRRSSSG